MFFNMGQSRPLFVYFRYLLITILIIQIEKKLGVLGIRTWGRKLVGADKTTELWWPPTECQCYSEPSYLLERIEPGLKWIKIISPVR